MVLIPILLLAGCGDPVDVSNSAVNRTATTAADEAAGEAAAVAPQARPVRIGELGANFAACAAAASTRRLKPGETLRVRAAPFENAEVTGAVAAGSRFFVCTRSHDQKWLGIVYDEAGLAARCGVSEPVTRRRDYSGPCRSGWVESAFAKLVSGIGEAPKGAENGSPAANLVGAVP